MGKNKLLYFILLNLLIINITYAESDYDQFDLTFQDYNISNLPTSKIDSTLLLQRKKELKEQEKKTENIEIQKIPVKSSENIKEESPKDTLKHSIEKQSDIPSLSDILSGKITQVIDQELKPFGYDIFNLETSRFSPITNIPVSSDYILGPSDNIIVDIWGGTTQHLNLIIDRDGKIVIPSVGSLYVAGVKFGELKELVKNKLSKEYQNIDIEVTMGRLRTIKIYIVGEVEHPGSYDISSLSTVYNALFSCGGPTKRGSLRKIEVIRDKKVVEIIDLYNFLLSGNRTNDIRLIDGDTIFVNLIGNTSEIQGMVKRPGIYEYSKNFYLKELIDLAGGVLPSGYLKNIQVERIINNENKVVLNLNIDDKESSEINKFVIQNQDNIKIFPILPIEKNVVYIKGHVYRPGKYELKTDMTLQDLIGSYKNLLPEPAETYGQIIRLAEPTFYPVVIPFNLNNCLNGKEKIELKPLDTIIIFSKWDLEQEPFVNITGEIRKPDKYRLFSGMKISDLIFLSGGIKNEAYQKEGLLFRIDKQRNQELIHFNLANLLNGEQKENLILKDEDKVVIRNIWDMQDKPIVNIEGAVRKPGKYTLVKGMKVKDVLNLAGDIQKDAFHEEYQIIRTRKDRNIEVLTFNLNKSLSGDEAHNVLLQDEDNIIIKNIWDIKEKEYVSIEGEVMKPSTYRLGEGMTIRDLIYQAGYIKKSAYLKDVEVIRYISEQEGVTVKKINVNLEKVLENNLDANIALSNMDKVFIKKIPDWDNIGNIVKISGQVTHPGNYSISKDEILSKVIERAGGFAEGAYLEGAVLTRKSVKELQKVRLNEMILKLEQEILRAGTQEAAASVNSEDSKTTSVILQSQKDLLEKLRSVEPTGRIIIKFGSMEKLKGTKDDVCLQNGDELFVPKRPDIVLVSGEVYNPSAIIYQENCEAKYYLNEVGGPTKSADESNMYVIKSDGTVLSKENIRNGYNWWNPFSWWSTPILKAKLSPGDTILVPEKVRVTHTLRDVKDVTSIIYEIAVATKVWQTVQ